MNQSFIKGAEVVLKQKANKFDIPESRYYTNYSEMLKDPELDAVSICTPNFNHFAIAREAIRNHIPFAVEKPITLTVEEAGILKNEAQAIQLPNMVCFSYRYQAAARYAKWIIEQGKLGQVYHIYIQYLQSWAIDRHIPLIWRFRKDLSGSGALGDLGSHMLDLSRFLVADTEKVFTHAGTLIQERKRIDSEEPGIVDVDDYCHWMAQLQGGISSTVAISRFAYGRGNYQRVEVYGSEGSLIYHLDEEGSLEVFSQGDDGQPAAFHKVSIPESFHADQMQAFIDIVNGQGDGLSATIEDGYINQKSLDAIMQSVKAETWVSI
jgi:predicted dehydrogenase